MSILILESLSMICLMIMLLSTRAFAKKNYEQIDYFQYVLIWMIAAIRNLASLILAILELVYGK